MVTTAGVTTDATSQEENAVQGTSLTQTPEKRKGKGVPNFWLYALKGCDVIDAKLITDHDEGALKHLENIKWSRIHKGFKLEFYFNTNPFFENPVLTKTYHMIDEDESFLEYAIGTEITWHPKKCLTQKLVKKSRNGSKKAKGLTNAKPMANKSFFDFFSPPKIPKNLKDKEDIIEVLRLKHQMQIDYYLGMTIRDEIIPRAVSWFMGDAALEERVQISAQHSDFLKSLSHNVMECVASLRPIQDKHDALKAKFKEDRASIQEKYRQSCQLLYEQRYNIINGDEADGDSIDSEADGVSIDSEAETNEEEAFVKEKGVPNFWLYALQNNDYIDDEITYRDEQCLKYLKDIKWSKIDDSKGFKLDFYFKANPFFGNSVLTKTYHMSDEDKSMVEEIKGTEIEWYPAKCLTQILIRKKPKTGSENAKSITTTEECDSFFSFFSALEVDAENELTDQMDHHFFIGSIIRDQIIPHAVSWFTGEAIERDDMQDDEDQYLGLEAQYDDVDDSEDEYEDFDDGLESEYEEDMENYYY